MEDFDKINRELEQYSPRLMKKPQIVAANKIDLISEDDPEDIRISKNMSRQRDTKYSRCQRR